MTRVKVPVYGPRELRVDEGESFTAVQLAQDELELPVVVPFREWARTLEPLPTIGEKTVVGFADIDELVTAAIGRIPDEPGHGAEVVAVIDVADLVSPEALAAAHELASQMRSDRVSLYVRGLPDTQ